MNLQAILERTDIIIIGLLLFYFLFVFLPPNLRGYRNRRQPTITIRATVVGKAQNMSNAIHGGFATRDGGGVYMLVFNTANGLQVTLTVPRDDYYNLQEGTKGILTYQGSKCEKLTPDKV